MPGFWTSKVGKQVYKDLVNFGYNCHLVTMQAALHGDVDEFENKLYPLSQRMRTWLLCSRPDVESIQIDNPKLAAPTGAQPFGGFGSKETKKLVTMTKLETSNNSPVIIPEDLPHRFLRYCQDAGLDAHATAPEIGHSAHPTRYNYNTLVRTPEDITSCRMNGYACSAVMTTPTSAGQSPNEVMPPLAV